MGWYESIHPNHRPYVDEAIQYVEQKTEPLILEYLIIRHNNKPTTAIDNISPVINEETGEIIGMSGFIFESKRVNRR